MNARDFTVAGAARHLADQVADGKMTPTLAWDTLAGVIRRADAEAAAEDVVANLHRFEIPVLGGGWAFAESHDEARDRALAHDGMGMFFKRRQNGTLSDAISATEEVAA